MAYLSNDTLDDALAFDGTASFVGGQVSGTRADLIPANAYAEGKNVDFDYFGNITTRRGAEFLQGNNITGTWDASTEVWDTSTKVWSTVLTAPVISAAWFDTGATERIVLVDSEGTNNLKYYTSSGASANIATISGSPARVWLAQLSNRMYYADGSNALAYVDSAAANQSIAAGKVTSIEIVNQGDGYNTIPTIAFTHNGGAGATATTVLGYGGKVLSATITAAGSGYVSTNPPTIAFSAGAATGIVKISQLPSQPKFLVAHTNRLFCTTAATAIQPDTLYASDLLDGESWDLQTNSIRVGGDGDTITALHPWFGFNLLVFKERSIWLVVADPTQKAWQWTVKLVNSRLGCIAEGSVQSVGPDVFFLARDGVRSIATIENGAQFEVADPISANVNDLVSRINNAALETVCSTYYRNRYMLAVPLDSATTPDNALVFHAVARSWLGYWTGWNPRAFVVTAFSGALRLQFGDQNGRFMAWKDNVADNATSINDYADGATPIASFIKTRAYDFGDRVSDKLGYQVQFDLENSQASGTSPDNTVSATFVYLVNLSSTEGSLAASVSLSGGQNLVRKAYSLLPKGKFARVQFKASASAGKLALHSVQASAFTDAIKAER